MAFALRTVASVPQVALTSNPSAHAFPWDECAESVEKTSEVAAFTIPKDYWAERGRDVAKLKPADIKTAVRNHFNGWQKADEKRKAFALFLSTTPDLVIDCYVQKAETQAAA